MPYMPGLEEEDELALDLDLENPDPSSDPNQMGERDPAGALSLGADPEQGPAAQPAGATMDPIVKEHLMKKFNLGEYSDENRKKVVDANQSGGFGERLAAGILQATGGNGQQALDSSARSRRQAIEDFDKGRANKIQAYTLDRQLSKDEREDQKLARESDPNSQESKMATEIAMEMGYKGPPLTAQQFKDYSPIMAKKFELKQKSEERQDARDERRSLQGMRSEEQAARREERKIKNSELSSTQAKQMGLYTMGEEAENQYNKATADKDEYDPTSVGQVIDNSEWAPKWMKNDKANAAQSAQAAWVESFLRDASGAAIPPSERMSYAKDYFPQPGDSSEIAANKAALRKQKKENALIGAGEQGKEILAKSKSGGSGMVKMLDPKGNIRMVPADQVAKAEKAGGKVVGTSVAGGR